MACIYKVVNDVGEVIYIGQTSGDIHTRAEWYCKELARGDARPIDRYFRTRPVKLDTVEECEQYELDRLEQIWIAYYAAQRPLLNILDNPYFYEFSDMVREYGYSDELSLFTGKCPDDLLCEYNSITCDVN